MFRHGEPGGRMYIAAGTGSANIVMNWTSVVNPAYWTCTSSGGRTGGTCLTNSNAASLSMTLDSQAVWGVTFALKANQAVLSQTKILTFYDISTEQVDLRINTDLTLTVTRNGTVLGTSTAKLNVGAWSHIEIKVTINNTAGTVELRINSVVAIGPLINQNTRTSTNNSANSVTIGSDYNLTILSFDDIIIWDGQATDANGNDDIHDFIGDCSLTWLLPSGAGTTTQWTPDSGSNYARVNEITPDGDTSYVASSTVGQIDTYAISDLATSTLTIKSIMTVVNARKDDVGARAIQTELRTNGANFTHPTVINLGNSYLYYQQNWGMNPSGTPAAWTGADINAIEAGQIVNS